VVQHRRNRSAADADRNDSFIVDDDMLMKKKNSPAPSGSGQAFQFRELGLLMRAVLYRRTAPGESPPLVEGPLPLSEVGPPAVPLGPPEPVLPDPIALPAPLVDELELPGVRPVAPGESPALVEGPVPLNEVGPLAVPLGPPCANADMPETANAVASAIVMNFMAVSFRLKDKSQDLCLMQKPNILPREFIACHWTEVQRRRKPVSWREIC
jgi:hypothetical protein